MSELIIMRDEGPGPIEAVAEQANGGELDEEAKQALGQHWDKVYMHWVPEFFDSILGLEVEVHKSTDLEPVKATVADHVDAPQMTLDSFDLGEGRYPLGLSRWFDLKTGEMVGHGNRPGFPSFNEQVSAFRKHLGLKPGETAKVVLAEDDVFTGETAKITMDELKKLDIDVDRFVAGIQVANENADPRIIAVESYSADTVRDVVDPRDVGMGFKDSGLVVVDTSGVISPMRTPYMEPFVNLTDRAGVPSDEARALSKRIASLNGTMYEWLGTLVGKQVTVADTDPAFQANMAHYGISGDKPMTELAKDLEEELS